MSEMEKKLETSMSTKKNLEEKIKKSDAEYKTDKVKLEKIISDLEADLQVSIGTFILIFAY